jgi:hypothetical protein
VFCYIQFTRLCSRRLPTVLSVLRRRIYHHITKTTCSAALRTLYETTLYELSRGVNSRAFQHATRRHALLAWARHSARGAGALHPGAFSLQPGLGLVPVSLRARRPGLEREGCQVGPMDAGWLTHSCETTAKKKLTLAQLLGQAGVLLTLLRRHIGLTPEGLRARPPGPAPPSHRR